MRYFSMFSGIGGFEFGIQKAYTEIKSDDSSDNKGGASQHKGCPLCIGYSEIDKHSIKTYETHYPKHRNYGDATEINPEELPDFDMLCGGFPCQAFSIAGKRMGFEDTRGTLFFDIARIAKAKKPRLLFLENVKGLLSHDNGRTFATILATLDELGYNAEWEVLNSKHFGVPQNRERVFIIGHLRGTSGRQVFPLGQSLKKPDGKPMEIRQLNNPRHSRERIYGVDGMSPTISTMQGGNTQPFVMLDVQNSRVRKECPALTDPCHNNIRLMINKKQFGKHQQDAIHETENSISPTLMSSGDGHIGGASAGYLKYNTKSGIRRLTPIECERLQGFPDNWTIGSDTQRYKQCGNAVTVNVIKAIAERMIEIRMI